MNAADLRAIAAVFGHAVANLDAATKHTTGDLLASLT